mmetsp:Transcript_6866/g.12493  ORF Transcript_6866/g.12493 Transcript_6866/m.12493 type:complete len:579 (-) Transcript_6866:4590-6326(-)
MAVRNISNIERKVLGKQFSAKHNDIQVIEESTSRFVPSLTKSPRSRIPTEMSQFSISDDMGGVLFSQHSSSQEVCELQALIDSAEEGSILTLPAQRIELKTLRIRKPLTIRGEAGSVLVVRGSIIVDFDHPNSDPAVFSELTLIHDFDSPKHKQPSALFLIGDYYSRLELLDCMLTSKPLTVGAIGVQNVAIWMHGQACKTKHIQSSEAFSSSLSVKSCGIAGFYFAYYGGINSKAVFERCKITESKGCGIFVIQPELLHVSHCSIDKCVNSSIDVKMIAEGSTPSTIHSSPSSSTVPKKNFCREVLITHCSFKSNSQHGARIRSESLTCSLLNLSVTHCSFSNMRKEALSLRHIVLLSLQVTHNSFKHNQTSHLWLQKVYPASISTRFLIAHNTCADSIKGYGIYMYSSVSDLIENECFRNGLGGIFVVAPKNYQGLTEVSIQKCTVYSNGETGISVANYSSGELSSTRVFDNCSSGIIMVSSESEMTSGSSVIIKECEIYQNHEFGLVLNKSPCELSDTHIKDNTKGAIYLDEESKPRLVFREPAKTKDLVRGTIGGSWGQLLPPKKSCTGECALL